MGKTAKEIKTVRDLTPDSRNANKGSQRGGGLLEDSLQSLGAGRSVLADRNGRLIAGNKTVEGAVNVGMEDVIVVPSDGTKLVVVQRTDLDLNDPKARRLAIADNRIGQINLDWDAEILQELTDEGVELEGLWNENELAALLKEAAPDDVDGGNVNLADQYKIIIDCNSESQQAELLQELMDRGLSVKAVLA